MTANDDSPSEGKGAAESIDYDYQQQLKKLLEGQGDLLYDLARPPREMENEELDSVVERYRKLSREAAFLADVIEKTWPKED